MYLSYLPTILFCFYHIKIYFERFLNLKIHIIENVDYVI